MQCQHVQHLQSIRTFRFFAKKRHGTLPQRTSGEGLPLPAALTPAAAAAASHANGTTGGVCAARPAASINGAVPTAAAGPADEADARVIPIGDVATTASHSPFKPLLPSSPTPPRPPLRTVSRPSTGTPPVTPAVVLALEQSAQSAARPAQRGLSCDHGLDYGDELM